MPLREWPRCFLVPWHRTDPTSGLPIAHAMLGEPAGSLEQSLIYEYRRPDLNRFDELRSRRSPVSSISTETGVRWVQALASAR